ncbi:MAG: Rid family detoxifying hydrolase [Ignavibacteria bacterium]|nr:Rid family detoxifying hydrolase [Ignavibacteria bacterium]
MKEILHSSKIPQPIGPYSQAIKAGDFIFTSGMIPIDLQGNVINGGIKEQTKTVLENLKLFLVDNNLTLDNVVKITVYLDDINDFSAMNEVYSSYMDKSLPARSISEVSKLPKGVKIEIDAIIYCGK